MTSYRQRNDAERGRKAGGRGPHPAAKRPAPEAGTDLLWGWHAVAAALSNKNRPPPRLLLATPERAKEITARFGQLRALEVSDNQTIARYAPAGAVHQGVLLKSPALEPVSLAELAEPASGVLVMLDQVTDPQNVGAIFRSAAAFGARGVIVQDRHAPHLSGALAKAAAGAVDVVPHAREINLSRALEYLADRGWRSVGLDASGEMALSDAFDGSPTVIVMGSEGVGLRRLIAEHCDVLARIPMPGGFESLNVSAAAAVTLYEASRPR